MPTPTDPLARPNIDRLSVYIPGKPMSEVERELGLTQVIKLASNENSLGPSPRALAAIAAAAGDLHLYPDNSHFELKRAMAAHLNVPEDWIALGAGGTALLRMAAEVYLRPGDRVVYPWPSFAMYPYYAQLMDAVEVAVPLTPAGEHDLDAMLAAAAGARMLFVCNPNNPTGSYVAADRLEWFLRQLSPETLVILDEAYFEYAREAAADYPDGIDLLRRGHRVLVLRTMSKVYGLAGLRIGCLIGPPAVIQGIRRVREPFHVNSLAQAAALGALGDHEHVRLAVATASAGRRQLAGIAAGLGLRCLPSVANFVLMDVGYEAAKVAEGLLRQGVIPRPSPSPSTWMRVTTGTEAENHRYGQALATVLHDLGRQASLPPRASASTS